MLWNLRVVWPWRRWYSGGMGREITVAYEYQDRYWHAMIIDAWEFDPGDWNMLKLARTETQKIEDLESMVRDLVATILDVEPDSFSVRFRTLISAQVSEAFMREEIERSTRT